MIAARERRARGVARIFDVARHLQRRHPRRLLGLVVLTLLLGPRLWAWLVMLLLPRVDTVIPPRIVFTYKVNLLSPPRKLDRREGLMRDNVMKTVDMNRALRAEVVFLDDRDCDWMIQQASGLELARHFRREPLGMYKADICRGASLFLHGGWYFDVDLESLLPIKAFIRPDTDFITVHERAGNGFFQARPPHQRTIGSLAALPAGPSLSARGAPRALRRADALGNNIIPGRVVHPHARCRGCVRGWTCRPPTYTHAAVARPAAAPGPGPEAALCAGLHRRDAAPPSYAALP